MRQSPYGLPYTLSIFLWVTAYGCTADKGSLPSGGDSQAVHADIGGTGGAASDAAGTNPSLTAASSLGGTITFTDIGAQGFWGRRLLAKAGDPRCNLESDVIHLGAAGGDVFCCREKHYTTTDQLSPFNEQMAFIMKGPMLMEEFSAYTAADPNKPWQLTSRWEANNPAAAVNFKATGPNNNPNFDGIFGDTCQWYIQTQVPFSCGPSSDPYCPGTGPDISYNGWSNAKLIMWRGTMLAAADKRLSGRTCAAGTVEDAPWVGFSASELMRDGWGKYFPCHCYDNTNGSVGAGCGEINVFEAVPESQGPNYGNKNLLSTGVRSFQVGSLGGTVCGYAACNANTYASNVDLVDICRKAPVSGGAVLNPNVKGGACPMWRRPYSERTFFILLDTASRNIVVGMLSPGAWPAALSALGASPPPQQLSRSLVDAMVALRLPLVP